MKTSVIVSYGSQDCSPFGEEERDDAWFRSWAYVAVAIAAFVAGLMVGQADRPAPSVGIVAGPVSDTVQPHPRALHLGR